MASTNVSILGLRKDISAMQGNQIELVFTLANLDSSPLDMTGYTVNAQVRKTYASTEVAINATVANNRIVWVDQALGIFKIRLEPAATVGIRFDSVTPDTWEGVYDVEINSNTTFPGVQKPWYGSFTLTREITRV